MSRTWYWPGFAAALLVAGCTRAGLEAEAAASADDASPPTPAAESGTPGMTQGSLAVAPGAIDTKHVGATLDAAAVREVATATGPTAHPEGAGAAPAPSGVPGGAELVPELPATSEQQPAAPAPGEDPTSAPGDARANPEPPEDPVPVEAAVPIQAMMDLEAHLSMEVKDVGTTIRHVRALVQTAGGQILEERVDDSKRESPSATFMLRVPSAGAFEFLGRLESNGVVRSRQITSRDVGKEYFDASLRLRSLERVLRRYHALLASARTVEDTLKVEQQIARVSAEIEQIKGELRWLKDRVARATVHLQIFAKGGWVEPVVTPEAKIYPGLRAVGSWDWRGRAGRELAWGAGVSVRFARHFSVDFDGLQNTDTPHDNLEMSLLTLGGEFYSDFLGAGRRRWLNPYLGFRGGYGRIDDNDQLLLGGTLGLELVKGDVLTWDLEFRVLSALADDLGPHMVVLPASGLNLAF